MLRATAKFPSFPIRCPDDVSCVWIFCEKNLPLRIGQVHGLSIFAPRHHLKMQLNYVERLIIVGRYMVWLIRIYVVLAEAQRSLARFGDSGENGGWGEGEWLTPPVTAQQQQEPLKMEKILYELKCCTNNGGGDLWRVSQRPTPHDAGNIHIHTNAFTQKWTQFTLEIVGATCRRTHSFHKKEPIKCSS